MKKLQQEVSQMKRRNKWLYCCIILCFLLITACASTPTVTAVWMDQEYAGQGMNKVLIMGITGNVSARLIFEDEFVSQLKNKGVDAVASHSVIQAKGELSRENIQSKIEDLQVDTILITKVIAKKQEEIIHPGTTYVAPQMSRMGYHDYYRRGYRYVHNPAYIQHTPSTITQYEVLSIESNLYEIKSEKLIMSIQSDMVVKGTAEDLIKSYIDMVMKELSGKNLIKN